MKTIIAKLVLGVAVLAAGLGFGAAGEASSPDPAPVVTTACTAPVLMAPTSDSDWAPFRIRPGQPY